MIYEIIDSITLRVDFNVKLIGKNIRIFSKLIILKRITSDETAKRVLIL